MNQIGENSYITRPEFQTREEKIEILKQEQNKRRASIFAKLEKQREIYKVALKSMEESKSIFYQTQRMFQKDSQNHDLETKFYKSKKEYSHNRFNSDLELSILQQRTNSFVSANRLNVLDFA